MNTPNNTYKGKPIKYFLIDRLAAGYDKKVVCSMFRHFFEIPDSDDEILKIIKDSEEEIETRRLEIIKEIDEKDLTSIILRHINKLDYAANGTEDVKDLTTIATGISNLVSLVKPKQVQTNIQKTVTTNNYVQINATFINDLEKDGIIKIIDAERFGKLFGGAPSSISPSSDISLLPKSCEIDLSGVEVIDAPPKKEVVKKENMDEEEYDGIGAFL
ncbi:MAG: hypothetical protein WC451_02725 [Patescibacteria group bacterium]|jgi:hypothetical protein